MAATTYGQVYYPAPTGVAANVPAQMQLLAASLEGDTVRSFVDTAARDVAIAALTTAQKKGVVYHLEGQGVWFYDGTTHRRVNGRGFTWMNGTFEGSSDSGGLFSFTHNLGTTNVSVGLTPIQNGSDPASDFLASRIKCVVREKQTNGVVCRAFDTVTGTQYSSAAFLCDWRVDVIG